MGVPEYTWSASLERSGAKALCDLIKESCDVPKVKDGQEKVKVTVTGVGANVWKRELNDELETPLNLE